MVIDTFLKRFVCWVFGECERVEANHREVERLTERVTRLEHQVRHEQSRQDWRPSDAFHLR